VFTDKNSSHIRFAEWSHQQAGHRTSSSFLRRHFREVT
jgi:hypothetical protein